MYLLNEAMLIAESVTTGRTSARGSPRIDVMLDPDGAAEGKIHSEKAYQQIRGEH
jgi:hypothetical protein